MCISEVISDRVPGGKRSPFIVNDLFTGTNAVLVTGNRSNVTFWHMDRRHGCFFFESSRNFLTTQNNDLFPCIRIIKKHDNHTREN